MKLHRRRAHNLPRKWSSEEESILVEYLTNNDFDYHNVQRLLPNRSRISIRAKTRKVRIKHDLFGGAYRESKQKFTEKIARITNPVSVYEAYAGAGHQTLVWIQQANVVYAVDKSEYKKEQFIKNISAADFREYELEGNWVRFMKGDKKIHFYHGDTVDAAATLRASNIEIDLLDLDTCGSSLPILPSLTMLLNPKHLVVTHGEFHSLRFKREDVLRRILSHRNINESPLPMTPEELACELDKAVKVSLLRAHNTTTQSFWGELKDQVWLGNKAQGMLRRHYSLSKPIATADCLNQLDSIS